MSPSPSKSESDAVSLCVELARTYSESLRRIDGKLSALHGLSFGDFAILHHLRHAHESRLRRTDLAELVGVTASAVTRSLLPLEKIGLVERQRDPRDARVGYARLTPAGHRLYTHACVSAELACRGAIQAIPTSLTSRPRWL